MCTQNLLRHEKQNQDIQNSKHGQWKFWECVCNTHVKNVYRFIIVVLVVRVCSVILSRCVFNKNVKSREIFHRPETL